jgi:SAM-dependent methyltransferase
LSLLDLLAFNSIEDDAMTELNIPAANAARHGGADFYNGGEKYAETFEIWGGLDGTKRVLDIGCGPGRMAIGIGNRFGWSNSLVGFDVIRKDVRVCQQVISSSYPNFTFHHVNAWNGLYNPEGDIETHEVTFPAADRSMDFAFATSVFTHLYKRDVARYLSEAMRVLDEGGVLLASWFIITPEARASCNTGRARFKFDHVLHDGTFTDFPDSPEEVIGFNQDEAFELIEAAGFTGIEFHRGGWSRTVRKDSVRHNQDVIVCRK